MSIRLTHVKPFGSALGVTLEVYAENKAVIFKKPKDFGQTEFN